MGPLIRETGNIINVSSLGISPAQRGISWTSFLGKALFLFLFKDFYTRCPLRLSLVSRGAVF